MSAPNSLQILRLYKDLLRYGQSLQLTDKFYFRSKIVNEFKKNKSLEDIKDISFNFEKGRSLLQKGRVL